MTLGLANSPKIMSYEHCVHPNIQGEAGVSSVGSITKTQKSSSVIEKELNGVLSEIKKIRSYVVYILQNLMSHCPIISKLTD